MSMSSKKPAGIATNPSDRLLELMHKLKASGSYRLLEPRMVFDGAAVETVAQSTESAPTDTSDTLDTSPQAVDVVAALASAPVTPDATANVLIFIDANVTDLQVLADAASRDGQIVILDPNRDGIEQIAEIVSHYSNLDAIHIVSHGAEGQLLPGRASRRTHRYRPCAVLSG